MINAFQLQKQPTFVKTLQRATIEEVPDEESNKTSEIPMFRIEVKEDDMVTEMLQEGETLLAYYPGQPIIGVFETETSPSEWDYPQVGFELKYPCPNNSLIKNRKDNQKSKNP